MLLNPLVEGLLKLWVSPSERLQWCLRIWISNKFLGGADDFVENLGDGQWEIFEAIDWNNKQLRVKVVVSRGEKKEPSTIVETRKRRTCKLFLRGCQSKFGISLKLLVTSNVSLWIVHLVYIGPEGDLDFMNLPWFEVTTIWDFSSLGD